MITRRNPTIVVEHPGSLTIPTSCFLVQRGGMVVICGGTTGYIATLDLRYHWMQQKRFQGSHFANDEQCAAVNRLVNAGRIDPCLAQVFPFDQVGNCHQMLYENRRPSGKLAVLVNASREGMTTLE